jgi:hypothetical protein
MLRQPGGIVRVHTSGCVILSELCGMHIPLELWLCVCDANETAGVGGTKHQGEEKLSLDSASWIASIRRCHFSVASSAHGPQNGPQSIEAILIRAQEWKFGRGCPIDSLKLSSAQPLSRSPFRLRSPVPKRPNNCSPGLHVPLTRKWFRAEFPARHPWRRATPVVLKRVGYFLFFFYGDQYHT